MSDNMSYYIANSQAEARLICLRSFRQEDGHTPWQVTNSPGVRITELQYPRRAREVLEMGPQVDEVVNCLTNFINDRQFEAKIESKIAINDVTQWTEWQLAAISYISDESFLSRNHSATVKAIIVRQKTNIYEGHIDANHQRRSHSADDVRRRRYDSDGSDGYYA